MLWLLSLAHAADVCGDLDLDAALQAPCATHALHALHARARERGDGACFDRALERQPDHAETWVKKGSALEKLNRLDDAIACYDRALEANHGMTLAYLYKGGLFNRMERYDEALACYEQALKTQQGSETAQVPER